MDNNENIKCVAKNDYQKNVLDKILYHRKRMLEKNEIWLVEPKNAAENFRIRAFIDEIEDMKWAFINADGTKKILVRIIKPLKNIEKISKLKEEAKKAYDKKFYTEAISKNLEAMSYEQTVSIEEFYYIGLSYYKLRLKRIAYIFFTIVKSMSLDFGIDMDEIDELLKECTPFKKISTKEMNQDYINSNIIELAIMDVIDEQKDLFESLSSYNLTEDEKSIVILKLAKEYYQRNFEVKGDKLIRIVEQNKNKSLLVKKLLDYTRSNKKLFINQRTKQI